MDEALTALAEFGDEAKLLAGGQSLIPLMNLRLAAPAMLVDIGTIDGLDGLEPNEGVMRVGALVRHADIESASLPRWAGPMRRIAAGIGHLPIRTRGTFGGCVAHADPAADWPLLAVTVDSRVIAASTRGERAVAGSDLFQMPFVTSLEPDEMVTAVELELEPGGGTYSWGFEKFTRRAGDFAIVSVLARLLTDEAGTMRDARIGLGGVGGTALRSPSAEAALIGSLATGDAIAAAAEAAGADVDPSSDVHGSSAFRRHLVRVLVRRALTAAASRSGDGL